VSDSFNWVKLYALERREKMNTGILLSETAQTGIFAQLKTVADSLYSAILTIGGPVAIASIAVALVVSMTSHNQKAVDASKQVIKWIIIAFIVLFLLGSIFNWIVKGSGLSNEQFGGL